MTMLDRRLKRMEERLLKSVPKEEINAILANTGRSVVKPAITAAGKKRSAEMAFEDDITSWAQTAPYLKQQRNTDGARTSVPPPLRDPTVDSDDGSHALPSKELQEHLAEVFFDYVYGQPYFLLHKPSFMRRLKGGTAPPILVLAICAVSARFSKHPAVQHERPFSAGESFAAEARRQLLKNFDTANITNLTVCILLGLHEFGTCHGGRSWAFGGMATRMAHALQLHKEADQDPMAKVHPLMRPDYLHEGGHMGGYMSFIDKEIRRRCFWACFVMDRFNSSGTERPCIINESEVEIQLPVHDRNLQLDVQAITEQLDGGVKDTSELPEEEKVAVAAENMGIGAYIVRAVAMYGRVVKYLNQGGKEKDAREMWDSDSHFAELRSELQHFIVDLPEAFQYTQANILAHDADRRLAQLIFLHIAYQQVRLFLHRSASNMAGSNQHGPSIVPQEFAVSAREVALEAATKIAEILQEGQERGAHVVAPFTGYCAFNASLIHLVRMFDSRPAIQMEAKKHMETCLKFLLQMRQYWGLFHPITDNLKLLYKKFAESYSRGTNLAAHREISRMLQYGDWFLKYPQGFPPEDLEDDPAKGRVAGDVRSPSEDAALSHRPDLQTADEFFARLGPHRQTPLLVGAVKHAENFMQSPSDTRSSPGHVQSPMTHAGTSMQSPPMHTPPMATNTPALIQKPAKRPRSIDTHKASHVRQTSMPQQSSSAYAGNFGPQETPSQLTSPLSARLPGMPTTSAARFSSYAPQVLTPQNLAAQGGVHFNHHQQPPQHPVSQGQTSQPPFLYDPSLIAALSTGLWQGFDQPMNTADISGFPEHQVGSSAWFMPFNSVPPDFETAHVGLNALGMLAANSGVGGVSGTAAESGGSLSAVTAAAERPGSSTSAAGVPAGGIAGYHGGGGRQQQQR
ncbi:fungal-specific transcription factor domain-containing protein [Sphaerosporella brunnea]|uniref:Fungal-specific transcription factor domain-containing protein n=1 Tax=Sphaerosporella brunnea TaxID=1250544 RepID=A0A5J5F7U4_9PEZI|nr:fungal-specific transcription factor domain-containing protein [Sphaerosporella brunnea]